MAWWRALKNWLAGRGEAPDASPQPGDRPIDILPLVRGATWHDIFSVARLLESHGVEYALIGGYAMAYNGLVRQTGDGDFLVKDTPENNRR